MYLGQGSILFTVPTRAQRIGWFGLYRGFRYLICNKAVVFDETHRIASSVGVDDGFSPARTPAEARARVGSLFSRPGSPVSSEFTRRPSVRSSVVGREEVSVSRGCTDFRIELHEYDDV